MIDINITLLYQLINFVVLFVLLHIILFKPIRQIMQDRQLGISSAVNDAKSAQDRAQALLDSYNASYADAKQKATTAYSLLYQQGLDAQRDMISAERAKASEALDKARADVAGAAALARTELKGEADRLSQEITSRLLGRAV